MSVDRKEANLKKLAEASDIQDKTKEAIERIQRQAAEAEGLGTQTLEELRRQGQQMDDINSELEGVSAKLDQSAALQDKFDLWAFNWIGGKKKSAMKEAAAEIALRNQEEHSKVKEVFQQEKYDGINRTWKRVNMVLCNDPNLTCNDLFDPAIQESMEKSHWTVDFNLSGIDAEGWTYGYDFASLNKTGAGEPTPKWNSYVRRRKWKFADSNGAGSAALNEIKDRSEARKNKQSAANSSNLKSKNADKIGYVPRNQQAASLTASGLTSSSMIKGKKTDQDLDDESAAGLATLKEKDAEIDKGIEAISNQIDSLNMIANTMKEETLNQMDKLDKIDNRMDDTTVKTTKVTARSRYLLK